MKNKLYNRPLIFVLFLLVVSIVCSTALSYYHAKAIESFSSEGRDNIDWAYFQVERMYSNIDKMLIHKEHINIEELAVAYDLFVSAYENLSGDSFNFLLKYNCETCSDKEYYDTMQVHYNEIGPYIENMNLIVDTLGWGEETIRFVESNNTRIYEHSQQLALLANQKLAMYTSDKQKAIIFVDKLIYILFFFQIVCFIGFSFLSLYYLNKQKKTQEELEVSNSVITRSRDETIKAYKSRTQMLARLAHEIRTPLNAILGFSQILDGDKDNPLNEEQQTNVNSIIKSSSLVTNLIKEILDLNSLESGKIEVDLINFYFLDVIDEINSILQPELKANNVRIKLNTTDEDDNKSIIYADILKTKQILLNLITNAIKYGFENTDITISSKKQEDFIIFSVQNYGNSIPQEQQSELFNEFYRAQHSDSAISGYGIGLSLCKKMCDLMNGSISFISKDNQTTFFVKLPAGNIDEKEELEMLNESVNYVMVLSEDKKIIDCVTKKMVNYKKVQPMVVPNLEYAKDILDYSSNNVKYLMYTEKIMDEELEQYLKEKDIQYISIGEDCFKDNEFKLSNIEILFKRWFE